MKISVEPRAAARVTGDYVVLLGRVPGGDAKSKTTLAAFRADLAALDDELPVLVETAAATQGFRPASGKRFELPYLGGRALRHVRLSFVDRDAAQGASKLDEWRKAGGDALGSAIRRKARELSIVVRDIDGAHAADALQALLEGVHLAAYEFRSFKGTGSAKREPKVLPKEVTVHVPTGRADLKRGAGRAAIVAEAVAFARDLVNTPPSDLPPRALVQHAKRIASGSRGAVSVKVFGKAELTRMGAGALLGVGRGSDEPPFLIHLSYRPKKAARGSAATTIIGKGVTFDSGGLSIKSGKGMEDMKCDMAGAAAVLATMRAIASLPPNERPPFEVHGVIPATENMVSGRSIKPGDVLRALDGKTIEVLNTDAEGRLILADALSYASRWKSDVIIDLATLTGACVVALGNDYAGLFATDDALSEELTRRGTESGERLWRLPLAAEYREQLQSEVADLRNIGTGGPGAILGALFLKEFVPADTKWAHLDIAGPAYVSRGNDYTGKGGTGFGVRTLLSYLVRRSG